MKHFTWILALWAFCLGCNLFDNGVRTLVVEPAQYCWHRDEHRACACYEQSAQEAWGTFCEGNPGHDFSLDFSEGFRSGFVDYLQAGGTGQPPPLPPRSYWDQRSCPEASLEWFAGFRMGAAMAQKSGLRTCAAVPTGTHIYNGAVLVYPTPCSEQPVPTLEPVPAAPAQQQAPPQQPAPSPEAVPGPAPLPPAPLPREQDVSRRDTSGADVGAPGAVFSVAPMPPGETLSARIPVSAAEADGRSSMSSSYPYFPNDLSGYSHESR